MNNAVMSIDYTSLQSLNTFSLAARAAGITYAQNVKQLKDTWKMAREKQQPFLLLGEGSNVLFLEDFSGMIVLNRIKGIELIENADEWLISIKELAKQLRQCLSEDRTETYWNLSAFENNETGHGVLLLLQRTSQQLLEIGRERAAFDPVSSF